MFSSQTAWFSTSVEDCHKSLWCNNGGTEAVLDEAQFIFSASHGSEDTKRILHSKEYLEEHVAVFHPDYIRACVRAGNPRDVVLGYYFLPPVEIQPYWDAWKKKIQDKRTSDNAGFQESVSREASITNHEQQLRAGPSGRTNWPCPVRNISGTSRMTEKNISYRMTEKNNTNRVTEKNNTNTEKAGNEPNTNTRKELSKSNSSKVVQPNLITDVRVTVERLDFGRVDQIQSDPISGSSVSDGNNRRLMQRLSNVSVNGMREESDNNRATNDGPNTSGDTRKDVLQMESRKRKQTGNYPDKNVGVSPTKRKERSAEHYRSGPITSRHVDCGLRTTQQRVDNSTRTRCMDDEEYLRLEDLRKVSGMMFDFHLGEDGCDFVQTSELQEV